MKKHFKYIFIFFFCLINTLFCSYLSNDEIWSFGFSYNIASGLIPYRDFNMVITPFFPLLFGIHMHILGTSILSFHILQALLSTVVMYFCFQLCGTKAWIFLLSIFFPINLFAALPSYNIFLLFLIIFLLYLEKKNASDFLVGLLLSISILTKQTTGCFIACTGLFLVLHQKEKFFQRIIGILLPLFLFLFYLLATNSFLFFWDQCFFGLLDFASSNSNRTILSVLFSILLWGILCIKIKRHPKEKSTYYILAFSSIILPLFDFLHIFLVFISIIFLYLLEKKEFPQWTTCVVKVTYLYLLGIKVFTCMQPYPNHFSPFNYRYINPSILNGYDLLQEIHEKYKEQDSYLLSLDGYTYKLINHLPIEKLDLINRGNLGYHGTEKGIQMIRDAKEGSIFIILRKDLQTDSSHQIDTKILQYVTKHYPKIESIGPCDLYRKEKEAFP